MVKKKATIGDLIEIPTSRGFAYAQYTHQHPQWGGLVRVFDTMFQERPKDPSVITDGAVRFSTFLPIRTAVHRGTFDIVGNYSIAPENRQFPVFRNGVPNPKTKKVSVWWLWDGDKEWKVGELTPEQRQLPILAVWNDTFLVERVETGW